MQFYVWFIGKFGEEKDHIYKKNDNLKKEKKKIRGKKKRGNDIKHVAYFVLLFAIVSFQSDLFLSFLCRQVISSCSPLQHL